MFELDSLPDRPLTEEELRGLRESDALVEAAALARAEDGVRHLAIQANDRLYGMGYRDDEGWMLVEERVAGDTNDLAAVRDALKDWAET
ncbi:MAG: hypothetical protein ACOCQL_07100 [Halolamina sp.]